MRASILRLVLLAAGATLFASCAEAGKDHHVVGGDDAGVGCAATDPDSDNDGVCDSADRCPNGDDRFDGDDDGVADQCDECSGGDDRFDGDNDGTPDDCDTCSAGNDSIDSDGDSVPDACDACPGSSDLLDGDGDGVPNGCDACPSGDDVLDSDSDGVPDGCDACPGEDDTADADADSVPDACDICALGSDLVDTDADTVPDACDQCEGFDDAIDINLNGIPDACEGSCDQTTDVLYNGICYYLDGSGGQCDPGFSLAPQSILSSIATMFVGKTYRHAVSDNCCVMHADQATELQDWGMSAQCNSAGPFTVGPVLGGAGCSDANQMYPGQLTLCQGMTTPICDAAVEVEYMGHCYYLDGSGGACDAGYELAPQSVLQAISTGFNTKTYKHQMSDSCCIAHADQAAEGQDWGMEGPNCNTAGPFTAGPELGGGGCTDQQQSAPAQLTLCVTQ